MKYIRICDKRGLGACYFNLETQQLTLWLPDTDADPDVWYSIHDELDFELLVFNAIGERGAYVPFDKEAEVLAALKDFTDNHQSNLPSVPKSWITSDVMHETGLPVAHAKL